jgi:adenylyltransferase/sulfurtransferase
MAANILSDSEIRRFQSQMNLPGIGKEGQQKIKLSKIGVIGAGGIGVTVLQYLASMGVGNFGIIDDGLVDELNIPKQTIYGATDLGKLKTIITRQKLQSLFPQTTYEIINLRLNNENIKKILKSFHLVIDASNNTSTSFLINDACIEMDKCWVYGAVNGSKLKVTVFNYSKGPSFRCYCDAFRDNVNGDESNANISVAYGFAGILMATETIKIITSQSNTLSGKLYSFDILSYQSQLETIKKVDKFFQIISG